MNETHSLGKEKADRVIFMRMNNNSTYPKRGTEDLWDMVLHQQKKIGSKDRKCCGTDQIGDLNPIKCLNQDFYALCNRCKAFTDVGAGVLDVNYS